MTKVTSFPRAWRRGQQEAATEPESHMPVPDDAADDGWIDFTPSPRILQALTGVPITPIDALCELIDNAVDSYLAAQLRGEPVTHREIHITVPRPADIDRGEGAITVRDAGAGLDRRGLSNALRAGYSEQNRFDALGLFGVGFNIAAGKLGNHTVITTSRRGEPSDLIVAYDLADIQRADRFSTPIETTPKADPESSGTLVAIDGWWPSGHQNHGFAKKLAGIGARKLRADLGRRYATLLREQDLPIEMFLNGDPITPFEHCVWDDSRFVERDGSQVRAVIRFDDEVARTRRCIRDGITPEAGASECANCGGTDFREVVERVHGWIGVQRYDDKDDFGIDVIRNGRAILVGERDAFFRWTDDDGRAITEYPVDDVNGRIVGEVHLDHVPVHFTKSDFERATFEWTRAMERVRGQALRPLRWQDGYSNTSPVSQLVRAYGRVRNFGPRDLYPAQWDPVKNKPARLPREEEQELIRRFRTREDGYIDDSKWFERVIEGAQPPPEIEWECVECGTKAATAPEECPGCGELTDPVECISCSEAIARSATHCPACGSAQFTQPTLPWTCAVCTEPNDPEARECARCGASIGTPDPLARETLLGSSTPIEGMSRKGLTVELITGTASAPIDLNVWRANVLPLPSGRKLPILPIWQGQTLSVFLDLAHPAFHGIGLAPAELVAAELATYWHSYHSELQGSPGHNLGTLTAMAVIAMRDDGDQGLQLVDRIKGLFDTVAGLLQDAPQAPGYFNELSSEDQERLAENLAHAGRLGELGSLAASGQYLTYASPKALLGFLEYAPEDWFDKVWANSLSGMDALSDDVAAKIRGQQLAVYARSFADCVDYHAYPQADETLRARAAASFEFLNAQIA
jgi:hypothetical protein